MLIYYFCWNIEKCLGGNNIVIIPQPISHCLGRNYKSKNNCSIKMTSYESLY